MRALIVEDDLVTQKVLRKFLEEYGFEVIVASDGAAAIELLESVPKTALLLLDSVMPEISGLEVLRRLRMLSLSLMPKVVMVTSENELSHIKAALSEGAQEYLMKPIDKAALYLKLNIIGL